jgi:putative restriction endonuclease
MAKGVFITKVDPTYDDLPETQYHFPHTYLRQAEQMVGDWIVYYEPRRNGGRQVYFATARVTRIAPDPKVPDHYYARMSDYLEFPNPVPFRSGDTFPESGLRNPNGSVNLGLFQRAVHQLPDDEYLTIVRLGMAESVVPGEDLLEHLLVAEPEADYGRRTVERLVNRPLRDAAFQKVVRQAYDSTCAFTGIRLMNGGGHCEIEAAHIRPVEKAGPDSPRNGMALSRTVHWMFDRGVISMEDDGRILMAKKLIPEPMLRALNPEGLARLPSNRLLRPHPQFLRFHRETVFKG